MVCEEVGKRASEYFLDGYLCSEAVLLAVCEAFKINSEHIPAMATAFGSGVARTDDVCGALNGGILALSLLYGRQKSDQSYEKLYAHVSYLKQRFNQKFTSLECTKLLGFSLNDTGSREKFVEGQCKEFKCSCFVDFIATEVCKIVQVDRA